MNALIRWPPLMLASAAACYLMNSPLHADQFDQHDVHEHGSVAIDIAVEDGKLSLEIRAPSINVVGFEHSPRSAQERAVATDALAMLESASGFVGVPANARCRLTSSRASPPARDEEHEHTEYSAHLSYVCDAAQNLEWLELWVLGKLRNVREARVNVITPQGQHSQRVRAPNERVPLLGKRQ